MPYENDNRHENLPGGEEKKVIPVVEEFATVKKEMHETGKVIISKTTEEVLKQLDIPLVSETIEVKRIIKNEVLDEAPAAVRYEGDVMIVSVVQEIVEIKKRIELIEELHITRNQTVLHEKRDMPLRKERVEVKREGIDKNENNNHK
ncbi:MAG: hypothetical protein JWN76_805 [Chitinophagaceae bacterium]|nr:hypothetical protein [Chitinophagaceae bacterium]